MQRIVKDTIGSDLSEYKVWYNLNYDKQTLMSIGNMDVRGFL